MAVVFVSVKTVTIKWGNSIKSQVSGIKYFIFREFYLIVCITSIFMNAFQAVSGSRGHHTKYFKVLFAANNIRTMPAKKRAQKKG
ncbi:hypothetical protein BEL04_07380 [Mucilaginibacter sp. PPCGB 2223]|nr:hypothetical protein BEL04_07380 [Mucilaginibacter sp. PPCGB 2223]